MGTSPATRFTPLLFVASLAACSTDPESAASSASSGGEAAFGRACANDAPDRATRPLPGELAQMDYFIGTWRCAGSAEPSHLWPAHPTTSTLSIEPDLNRHWLMLRMSEDAAADNELPLRSSGWWGYDASSRSLVRIFATNFGGWGEGRAPGFRGDELVWTGQIHQGNGQSLSFRHTITRRHSRSFQERFEVRDGGDSEPWVLRGSSTCTKQ